MDFMGESLGLPPRVEKVLSALRGARVRRYVDFGCSDGSITEVVARFVNTEEVYGVNIDSTALVNAVNKTLSVIDGLPKHVRARVGAVLLGSEGNTCSDGKLGMACSQAR